jgi:hypothetical protein
MRTTSLDTTPFLAFFSDIAWLYIQMSIWQPCFQVANAFSVSHSPVTVKGFRTTGHRYFHHDGMSKGNKEPSTWNKYVAYMAKHNLMYIFN